MAQWLKIKRNKANRRNETELVSHLKCGDAIAVLLVVEPLAFVFEAVGSLADAKSGPFVILPFAHISLRHARLQLLVLSNSIRFNHIFIQSHNAIHFSVLKRCRSQNGLDCTIPLFTRQVD